MADKIELSTLGHVIKGAYESQADTNAFSNSEKAKLAGLAQVASTGAYGDLTGLPSPIPMEEKARALGVATLDAAGVVPLSQLNVSGLSFKGPWDPVTNTPVLVDGSGSVGDFYKATAAGTFNFGNGDHVFQVGDWAIYAGGTWQRIGVHEQVQSVNGQIGPVELTAADVGALPDTYTPPAQAAPTWGQVTEKPDFPALYQPKQRGSIGPPIPALLVHRATNQSVATGMHIPVLYNAVVYDQFAAYTPSTGQIVIPSWARYARFSGRTVFAPNGTGGRATGIVLMSGADTSYVPGAAWDWSISTNPTTVDTKDISTGILPVTAGQVYRAQAFHTAGAALAVHGTNTHQMSWLQVEFYEGA